MSSSADKYRWPLLTLIMIIFFLGYHDIFYSLRTQYDTQIEDALLATEHGSLIRQAAFLSLGVMGLLLILLGKGQPFKINGFLGTAAGLYFIWCFGSVAWSDDPFLAFKRLATFLSFCTAAYAMASRLPFDDISLFGLAIPTSYVILGLMCEIALGRFHPAASTYRFAGTVHPNAQAIICGLMLIAAVSLALHAKKLSFGLLLLTLFALVALFLTKSRTGLWSAVSAIALVIFFRLPWKMKLIGLLGLSWLTALAVLIFGDQITSDFPALLLLGREDPDVGTLRGRMDIWKICLDFIARRPLTGYGFNSFWTPEHIREISQNFGIGLTGSHSGYLEMLLSLGIIGLTLALAVGIGALRASFLLGEKTDGAGQTFFRMLALFAAANSFLESQWIFLPLGTFFLMWGVAYFAFVGSNPLSSAFPANTLTGRTE